MTSGERCALGDGVQFAAFPDEARLLAFVDDRMDNASHGRNIALALAGEAGGELVDTLGAP